MEDFAQGGPFFFGLRVGHGVLHGIHDLPPALGFGVGGHDAHVGGVVGAVVFEVGEEHAFAQEDAVVADVAHGDAVEHGGPDLGVVADVLGFGLRAQADDLGYSLKWSLKWLRLAGSLSGLLCWFHTHTSAFALEITTAGVGDVVLGGSYCCGAEMGA